MADPEADQRGALALAVAGVAEDGQGLGVQVDGPPVIAQPGVADRQPKQMVGVQGRVGDPAVDAAVQVDQGAVVAPHLQVVEVDVGQHGGRGVVVAGVAAQLELGQLRPDVFQGAPGLPRRPDLGVVVRGAGLQARQRERGRGIARAARRELAARVLPVDRVQVVVPVLEPHQLAADQPGQDGRGVGGGVDRPEQEVDPDRRDRRRVDGQGLHHLLRGRVQQLVGLPDQHLDHLVFGQVAGAVQQVARGEGGIAVQDRLDRLQRPREPAGVPAQPVQQLLGGIAQPEAAVIVEFAQHDLGVRGAQALVQPQLALPGRLDLQQRGRRHPGGGDHRDRVRGRGQHRGSAPGAAPAR